MHSGTASHETDRGTFSSAQNDRTSLAAQLERAKEDLELVSYAASHDLQAPLRAIIYACEELSKHPAILADKSANTSLQKITHETSHMKTLMQGMLDYLRLETFGPAHSMLDCNELVTTARSILEEKIQATGTRITSDTLPQVYGHRGRLTRLFVNLLDNALKFHGPLPAVYISALRLGDNIEFCVEDNGIGIDEEYHNIIFILFQRLHTADAYPGDGIGLALSRKIVESHGGKLWVESAPGEGARFKFTLPATKKHLLQEGI